MSVECPHCGQPMTVRHGIKLRPLDAQIFDMIEKVTKGRGGIECDSLAWTFYPGIAKITAANRIRVHVNQINDMLVSTDLRIRNRDGLYRLVEEAAA